MIRKITLFSIYLIFIFSISCKKTYENSKINIVINEVMPVNTSTQSDPDGEYDDWIELYNLTGSAIDLTGFYLSDDKKDASKWQFPEGTIIGPKGYLIVWADNDTYQQGLHATFKLSSTGENVIISDPDNLEVDKVSYPEQNLELSYSRVPDGTGDFEWRSPTFNRTNGSK